MGIERGVQKDGVSHSIHLLKPQPLPRQYWGVKLRTSFIGQSIILTLLQSHVSSSNRVLIKDSS